jgi:hypothetical protein
MALGLFDGVAIQTWTEASIFGPSPTGAINESFWQDYATRRFVLNRSTANEAPFAQADLTLDLAGRMAVGNGVSVGTKAGVFTQNFFQAYVSTRLAGNLILVSTLFSPDSTLLNGTGAAATDELVDQFFQARLDLSVGVEYTLHLTAQTRAHAPGDGSTPTYATADFYSGQNGAVARLKVVPEPPGLALFLAALGVAAWAVRRP